MKERIKQFIEYENINAGELATLIEVQRSNISHILNGRNKPGAAFIEKMLLVFPNLNARWLLTGEGKMLGTTLNSTKSEISHSIKNDSGLWDTAAEVKIEKEKQTLANSVQQIASKNKVNIAKVILIYDDGSFSSFNPSTGHN